VASQLARVREFGVARHGSASEYLGEGDVGAYLRRFEVVDQGGSEGNAGVCPQAYIFSPVIMVYSRPPDRHVMITGGRMAKQHNPDVIRFMAGQLEMAAIELDETGNSLPDQVDASVLGPPIRDTMESVAANVAAFVTGLEAIAGEAREAARHYYANDAVTLERMNEVATQLLQVDPRDVL
jgi:hypothetical protein